MIRKWGVQRRGDKYAQVLVDKYLRKETLEKPRQRCEYMLSVTSRNVIGGRVIN
jgi:uncharacterized protein YcfJ